MRDKLNFITGKKDMELKERMLRSIVFVGGITVLIAIVEILIVFEITSMLLPFLVLLILTMGISLVITFKFKKYNLASILLGLVIVVIVMPTMFFLRGALGGGAAVWLTLGVVYIYIMFSGVKLYLFLGLCAISYVTSLWYTYSHPEIIIHISSEGVKYADALFSVMAVGTVCGLIMKSHMTIFEAEHQLFLQQREELEQASKSKNAVFANMSHEIRTPINAIIGLNEMILRENPEGTTRTYAQDIQVASKMLLNQVNDILDLSQVEMNKMRILPVKYRSEEMLREVVEMLHVQVEKKKLDFFVDVDEEIPAGLLGDEKRIKQVLINILDNAVKYTAQGSVTLQVETEEKQDGEVTLVMKVADTGIGIRKEDLTNIYDSFNRVDERKNSRILGSGLGLAITKQLVDLMAGEITIDSIYTKGTVFTVKIKQKVVDETPIGMIDFSHRKVSAGEEYKPLFEAPEARILIVDDNKMNAMVAEKLLTATNVKVDVAYSGEECLAKTKQKYYHIILLDDMMPDMNGEETLKAVRNQENGLCRITPVIALTANTFSGAREMYLEQGFDGYAEKPIQGKTLEAELLKYLPSDIVEYQESMEPVTSEENQIQRFMSRKRKKVYITTDCVCDIPTELLEKYDIKVMYLYVKTPHGRFADTREIDSDSYSRYIALDSSSAFAGSVTVAEYEEFFAEVLTEAERVIHIAMTSTSGASYRVAVAAAKGFEHVMVLDSAQISCGQALTVLHAAKRAMDGMSAGEICKEVEMFKSKIQTGFILQGANVFHQNNRIGNFAAALCNTFELHPYGTIRGGKVRATGLLAGNLESAWKQGIRYQLRKKDKISPEVVYITHVNCSVKQIAFIKKEILKYIPFKKVIVNKASLSVACNVGVNAIGIAYYLK